MTYRLNEVQLALPGQEVQDASINILKFADLGTSLIVSRALLGEGETLQSNFEAQLKKLQEQVGELCYQAPRPVRVGADRDVAALEVRSQFNKGAECIYQYQLGLVLPGSRQLLALSYVKTQPMGDSDNAYWANLKDSLILNHQP